MFTTHAVLALCFMLSFSYGDPNFSEPEIMGWKAPQYLKTKFPYYLSGYDHDGSPVFVIEVGKWNFRSAVEAGPETVDELDKWMSQMMLRWRTAGNEALDSPGAVVIADIEGIDIVQLGHVGVIQLMLKQFPKFHQLTKLPGMKKVYIVNGNNATTANYLFERVYELGKPMLGEAANLIEMYGSNSGKWKPVLLRDIPAEEIPAWYGGSKSHRAIQVFG